jgi:thioredoxin 1
MNVDDNPRTPMKFSVRGIPTLILFKDGRAEGQKIGAVRKADVAAFLDGKL